jgi:hypothetical protein
MSAQVFQHDGNCLFEGTWTAITAARSFDASLLSIPKDATHWVRYTTGATAALIPGETLEGGTSGETCILVAQAVESGTAGSSDTGILFVRTLSGAFEAETLTGTGTGTVDIIQDFIKLSYASPHPKAVLVVAESYSVTVTTSGTTPTAAAGTNHGITLSAGQSWVIRGINNIRNFQAINTVASSGALMKYCLYY